MHPTADHIAVAYNNAEIGYHDDDEHAAGYRILETLSLLLKELLYLW